MPVAVSLAMPARPVVNLRRVSLCKRLPLLTTHYAHGRIVPNVTDDEARRAEAKRRLRAALDAVELLPEETADDRVIRQSTQAQRSENDRDAEFVRNKPPHHG